ncbi:hypothetical protein EZV73_27545 [Acidaminobacter sp. JC074]|uniref:DUF6886 family protein n=1 Tax=Acidaminobacter sp. JC074 TaxID=2530199 RepID=UPI001F110C6D|nr:DUF6886 family protein [Acidaminobacter sp. JC074]MCH4891356.1 hypothetical protein [Acidaminobacter sp. JC074]
MRLFHVSEENDIELFKPRIPLRNDLGHKRPLVWAVNEKCLVNFFTPRDCPRLTYHIGPRTSEEDKRFFFSDTDHVLVIEHGWFERMKNTKLYIYEFQTDNFILQDEIAGYYVSEQVEIPIACYQIDDLFSALMEKHVEIRMLPNLWTLRDRIVASTLNYSLCRMIHAKERHEKV